jgi:hypothetical protein
VPCAARARRCCPPYRSRSRSPSLAAPRRRASPTPLRPPGPAVLLLPSRAATARPTRSRPDVSPVPSENRCRHPLRARPSGRRTFLRAADRGRVRGHDPRGNEHGRDPVTGREHARPGRAGTDLDPPGRGRGSESADRSVRRCASAHLVTGRCPDRVPGLLGRQLRHLGGGCRRSGAGPLDVRPLRRSRAALGAGWLARHLLLGSGRHVRHLGSGDRSST